jgi:hypothetical protein
MTEEEARPALLQTELNSIQSFIRDLNSILLQIKGWCVTAALAIGGFAVAYRRPELIVVGIGAVTGFYMINCQFKMIQRSFIKRNQILDSELKTTGIMTFLKGGSAIDVVGTAAPRSLGSEVNESYWRRLVRYAPAFWSEARLPDTFSLYLFILVCLIAEAIILW